MANYLTKKNMRVWLTTYGRCHERLCISGKGWGFCDCVLAQALRKFELEVCVRKREVKRA